MPAVVMTILRVGLTWLGRIGLAAFAVSEVQKLTKGQKDYFQESLTQAESAGATTSEVKQLIAATTYEQVEKEGKNPDDFWEGLTEEQKALLEFSPKSLRRSMGRTKFLGLTSALLFVSALASGAIAGLRGIPILLNTLAKLATARTAGVGALGLMTIIEEGKILGIARVWIPGLVGSIAAAGGWLTSTMANNLNDADLWGRIFLGQSAEDFESAAKQKGKAISGVASGGGTIGGVASGGGTRTIIRMVTESKPTQFIGTLFSSKLGSADRFERAVDDQITDMEDLEADVKLNLNRWLASLPNRMGYSVVVRTNPVDENGVQQSGTWATLTLLITHISGKTTPIDTILLGPVDPKVRMEITKQIKTIENDIEGFIDAVQVREITTPVGTVDIFNEVGERVSPSTVSEQIKPPSAPIIGTEVQTHAPIHNVLPIRNGDTWADYSARARAQEKNTPAGGQRDWEILMGEARFTIGRPPAPNTLPELNQKPVAPILGAQTLQIGATGEAVKQLQLFLNTQGHNLVVDGVFGQKTRNAVVSFQQKSNIAVDGIVGSQTKTAIANAITLLTR